VPDSRSWLRPFAHRASVDYGIGARICLALGDYRGPSLDSVIVRGQMVLATNHEPLPAAFAGS